jgi:hypothetical protein
MTKDEQQNHFCRVCGLDQGEPVWEDETTPLFIICPCCGTESGYHDCCLEAIRVQRARWLTNPEKWHFSEDKMADWDVKEQMKNIPKQYL